MAAKLDVNAATDALVVIDVQRDFCPDGALPVPHGDQVVAPLNEWLAKGVLKVATRDWHPLDHGSFKRNGGIWPDHCVQDTEGAQFHPDLHADLMDRVFSTGIDPAEEGYSGFEAPDLEPFLRERGVERLWIGGLATEYCVKETTLSARRLGFEALVIEACTRGIEVNPGDCAKALQEMKDAGAVVV